MEEEPLCSRSSAPNVVGVFRCEQLLLSIHRRPSTFDRSLLEMFVIVVTWYSKSLWEFTIHAGVDCTADLLVDVSS